MEINQIQNLITNDDLPEAIDGIKELIGNSSNLKEQIILLESRLRKLMKEIRQGIINKEHQDIESNKIRNGLLSLVGELRSEIKENDSTSIAFTRELQKKIISEIEYAKISCGIFFMGSNKGLENEKPVHEVKIEKEFEIGIVPVTQKQWRTVMETEPWKGIPKTSDGDKYPATYITWIEAETFMKRLVALDSDFNYRFPTEAEWEYCCRAGTQTEFHFGDDESKLYKYGWFDKNVLEAGYFHAQEVGEKDPNQWGIYDMHGNIWEWVDDWYVDSHLPEKKYDYIDDKVLKGGGWDYSAFGARAAFRYHSKPIRTNYVIGFRVVREKR